jgi:predicted ester cyclase
VVASRAFRKAVPDLAESVEEAWVAGDNVISRYRFSGHFSGTFGDRTGDGRAISFDAIDIYTIRAAGSPPTGISRTTSRCYGNSAS